MFITVFIGQHGNSLQMAGLLNQDQSSKPAFFNIQNYFSLFFSAMRNRANYTFKEISKTVLVLYPSEIYVMKILSKVFQSRVSKFTS